MRVHDVFKSLVLLAVVAGAAVWPCKGEESALWGRAGEKWSPGGRLPDFSWAGYHCGDAPIPSPPPGISVKDFGAAGDGKTDDTAAFAKALGQASGAVEVPPGRYLITGILEINRPGVVLRGSGSAKTALVCPKPLQEIKPNWGATTSGRRTSNYSWSGGIVWFKGDLRQVELAAVVNEAKRAGRVLEVSSVAGMTPGLRIAVCQFDNASNSLADHLYSGDPGDTGKLNGSTRATLVCRIVRVFGNSIEIDRPLRFDIRNEWKPAIHSFDPSVRECGVEGIRFEFPAVAYGGHFAEMGHNAIALDQVADCWARDIHIVNSDSGIFITGSFCTVQNIVLQSEREPVANGAKGHHGVYIEGNDNLLREFDCKMRFIHDISVSHCAGNVIADGKSEDLCLDHHKRAPYENLFTNLDAGKGGRLWSSGGGAALGKHCAARGTFWNIRAERVLSYPPEQFAPPSINVVGLRTGAAPELDPHGKWTEATQGPVEPANLHEAQLQRRLSNR
jgi:hypothetical protein